MTPHGRRRRSHITVIAVNNALLGVVMHGTAIATTVARTIARIKDVNK